MAVVTQNWSDFSWKPGESASITFLVSGVGLMNHDAVAAVQSAGIYQADNTLSFDPSLVANQPEVSRIGPDLWQVKCTFSYPAGGSSSPPTPDPLDEPAKIKWSFSNSSEEFNRDIHGNPFSNANGDPFSSGFHKDIIDLEITITRNFPDFDANWNVYADTLNDAARTLLGRYTFQPGTMRFIAANPTIEYDSRARFVPVAAIWKWRKDGWKIRVKNVGRNGFWNNNGTITWGQFYDKDGQPVSDEIPINHDGTPIDHTIVIGPAKRTPVSSPYPLPAEVISSSTSDGSIFLFFDAYPLADHSQLPF